MARLISVVGHDLDDAGVQRVVDKLAAAGEPVEAVHRSGSGYRASVDVELAYDATAEGEGEVRLMILQAIEAADPPAPETIRDRLDRIEAEVAAIRAQLPPELDPVAEPTPEVSP